MAPRPPSPPSWLAVTARLADALPALAAGDAGCLMPDDLDPDALALLDLLDGAGEPWEWRRDAADPALVALRRPVLGVEVAAADPCVLATAVELLADAADRAVPAAHRLSERLDAPLSAALGALLRRDLPRLAAALPDARFRPAGLPGGAAAPAVHPDRAPLHAPEVEDHRLLRQR